MQPVVMLVIAGVAMFSVIGGVSLLSHYYTLNGIKSRTVGDGQHGTARFATKRKSQKPMCRCPMNRSCGAGVRTCRLHRDWYSAAWSGQENYTHWWIPGMCIA